MDAEQALDFALPKEADAAMSDHKTVTVQLIADLFKKYSTTK